MNEHPLPAQPGRPKTHETFQRFRRDLARFLPQTADEITPGQRFEKLIPANQRRRVWRLLAEEGVLLPALRLSGAVRLAATIAVLGPLMLLAVVFKEVLTLLSVGEIGFLAYKLTRRWAIRPPAGCETVQEAVLHLTPFRRQDYEAGLWPREDIAAKVRLIVARSTGIPFTQVTNETRLDTLCG